MAYRKDGEMVSIPENVRTAFNRMFDRIISKNPNIMKEAMSSNFSSSALRSEMADKFVDSFVNNSDLSSIEEAMTYQMLQRMRGEGIANEYAKNLEQERVNKILAQPKRNDSSFSMDDRDNKRMSDAFDMLRMLGVEQSTIDRTREIGLGYPILEKIADKIEGSSLDKRTRQSFDEAFMEARREGKKTFIWEGDVYRSSTAEEELAERRNRERLEDRQGSYIERLKNKLMGESNLSQDQMMSRGIQQDYDDYITNEVLEGNRDALSRGAQMRADALMKERQGTMNFQNGGIIPDTRTGTESSLSPYVGDYVVDMLGRGRAAASQPYTAYTGPLTAGASDLQQQAFTGISGLTTPTDMGSFSITDEGFDMGSYMNPYISSVLNPQIEEINRQAAIGRLDANKRLTGAGAFGGSRQAVMDSELERARLDEISQLTGRTYADAYDKGIAQFNRERDRATDYGFDVLDAQLGAGGTQRGILGEGIAADYKQFIEERDYPLKTAQYMQSLLQELPLDSQTYQYIAADPVDAGIAGVQTGVDLITTLKDIFGI